jgi:hypothetical protein
MECSLRRLLTKLGPFFVGGKCPRRLRMFNMILSAISYLKKEKKMLFIEEYCDRMLILCSFFTLIAGGGSK